MVTRAAAQQKLSQAEAKYQTTPKDDQRCDGCANFQSPNVCRIRRRRHQPERLLPAVWPEACKGFSGTFLPFYWLIAELRSMPPPAPARGADGHAFKGNR